MNTDIITVSEAKRAELVGMFGEVAISHSERFRKVATGYPHVVALAYGRYERAAADNDETVLATVADWERSEGIPTRDWTPSAPTNAVDEED